MNRRKFFINISFIYAMDGIYLYTDITTVSEKYESGVEKYLMYRKYCIEKCVCCIEWVVRVCGTLQRN
jgi:hypothetical protein